MGWSSATEIFDGAVEVAIAHAPKIPEHVSTNKYNTPDIIIKSIVHDMYTRVEWDDWDTQQESKFYHPHLFDVMHELGELDDEDY